MSVAETTRDLTQRLMAKWRSELQQNAEIYANARTQNRRSSKPNQIISPIGFTDHPQHLTCVYYPPRPGTYRVFPDKKLRPWRYIALHVGDTGWDRAYFKRSTAVQPPGDDSGYNPERWTRLVQQYILPMETSKNATVCSAHYLVNRLGDVIASVDLNDIAYHMPKGFPKLFNDHDNNYATVGIVFEPCYVRLAPNSNLSLLEFSMRQQAALAVLIKKLTTMYPIEMVVIRRFSNVPLTQLTKQNPTGIITTFGFGTSTTPTSPFLWPVPAPYQKPPPSAGTRFGAGRPKAPNPHLHQGIDLANGRAGVPVYAAAAGKIYLSRIALGPKKQYKPGTTSYGGPAFVWIRHPDGWDTHYHHLDETNLPYYVGTLPSGFTLPPSSKIIPNGTTIDIAAGQLIGYTAYIKSGSHLHFEIRKREAQGGVQLTPETITYGLVIDPKAAQRGGIPLDPMTMLGGENPVPSEELQRLFATVGTVRKFNLGTDVFIEKLQEPDFSDVTKLASQITKGTLGQTMAALSAYHRVRGIQRAVSMQTQSRQALSQQGITSAASLYASAAQHVAGISAASNRSSVEGVVGMDGGPQYDFETGLWQDGKAT